MHAKHGLFLNSSTNWPLIPRWFKGKQRILDTASRIATIQTQNGMDTPEEDFKRQFHFGLVEVVFEWARGMPFAEITNLTDVQEG